MDSNLHCNSHMKTTTKSAYFVLIIQQQLKDICRSKMIRPTKKVQKRASEKRKLENITPVLRSWHWLFVRLRVDLLIFKKTKWFRDNLHIWSVAMMNWPDSLLTVPTVKNKQTNNSSNKNYSKWCWVSIYCISGTNSKVYSNSQFFQNETKDTVQI